MVLVVLDEHVCLYYYDVMRCLVQVPVPVKWMALESLTHMSYSTKSDV